MRRGARESQRVNDRLVIPFWLVWATVASAAVHDVAVIVAGWSSYSDIPRTISSSLSSSAVTVWSLMLVIGGFIALVGLLLQNVRLETTGCVLTSAAKIVWMVAALSSPTQGSRTLVFILIAGATGTLWRVWVLFASQVLRVRD